MTAILTEEIRSYTKGLKLYGKKGDKVTVVKYFGNVTIVELKGNRFPVDKSKIKIIGS